MDRDLVCSSRRDSSLRRDRHHRSCRYSNPVQRLRVMDYVSLIAFVILGIPATFVVVYLNVIRTDARRLRKMRELADRKREGRS
jgi:hypothetical protein